MMNPGRKKRKKNTVLRTVFRLFFFLLLLSMLAAYISNQVAISSKRAELQTLNEQIEQQQTKNEELQRILSGDADDVTEWVARDSYNYAAPNERIFVDVTGNWETGPDGSGRLCGQHRGSHQKREQGVWSFGD